jgi:peptide-methionine (S)-S-oxide reductase
MEKATFAAGCFWGVEAAFRQIDGVVETAVGYSGGDFDRPSYEDVCSGKTGHAESVMVVFDPQRITYEQLLDIFWNCHDPTTENRQGPDVGSQYRSMIFYHNDAQRAAAAASKERHQRCVPSRRPIVTEIVPATTFHRAEEYHQRYFQKHGLSVCHTRPAPEAR